MFDQFPVVIVVAMGEKTRVIGNKNELLWHVPEDLKRFKTLTLGHPIIMGRKTFESIVAMLGKPLPGRTNIVITRNTKFRYERILVATSLKEAFEIASLENPTEIHIGGGGEVYHQALPFTDRIYATIFAEEPVGDVFFPEFTEEFVVEKKHEVRQHKKNTYQWIDYVRKK